MPVLIDVAGLTGFSVTYRVSLFASLVIVATVISCSICLGSLSGQHRQDQRPEKTHTPLAKLSLASPAHTLGSVSDFTSDSAPISLER